MKKRIAKLALCLGTGALLGLAPMAMHATASELEPSDCLKCHDTAPQDIAANGGKHKTEITCIDCHEGHPPRQTDIIPQCSKCHEGEPHFELQNCLGCHSNPHTPLAITIDKDITQACLTCHTDQMAQLQQYESKHTKVACSTCHRERHGMIPECLHCHSGHSEDMSQQDCLTCHRPHMPLEVTYPEDVSSKTCAACHDTAYELLTASPARHSKLSCATCHQEKHKMIPKCQDCHGNSPHPAGILSKFPECGQCHGIAHDLNK